MKVPELVELIVTADGHPLADALVHVSLPMPRKNAFGSCHGPSDEHGRIEMRGRGILESAQMDRDFILMDYEDLEWGWKGELCIRLSRGRRGSRIRRIQVSE